VDVYTYLSSRRLLTAPTPVEKKLACVDRMAVCLSVCGAASRVGFFLFFAGGIHLATSLCDPIR